MTSIVEIIIVLFLATIASGIAVIIYVMMKILKNIESKGKEPMYSYSEKAEVKAPYLGDDGLYSYENLVKTNELKKKIDELEERLR
jgi:hypothetical protein